MFSRDALERRVLIHRRSETARAMRPVRWLPTALLEFQFLAGVAIPTGRTGCDVHALRRAIASVSPARAKTNLGLSRTRRANALNQTNHLGLRNQLHP